VYKRQREQSIRISNTGGLSGIEVEQMRQEAQVYAELDRKNHELVQYKNQIEALQYNYKNLLSESNHLIDQSLSQGVAQQFQELQALIAHPDVTGDVVKDRIGQVQQDLLSLGSGVYRGTERQSQSPVAPTATSNSDYSQSENFMTVTEDIPNFEGPEAEWDPGETVQSDAFSDMLGGIDETVVTEVSDYETVD